MPTFEIVVALVVGAGALIAAAVKVGRFVHRATQFLDDWFGEPERDGVDERPGVLKRLKAVEDQLQPNGGGSLRDSVNRTEKAVQELRGQIDSINTRLDGAA